ncbi:retropepsin-like aspartic protease family protein [Variovorax sp. VNK109]|jgi:aspartyl protease family protein|uniref:retropepsin-like aspartic protease family protein n=1 Tax=Variovorax sp. VNK109 TaxID=3400919 RepID=UPI003C111B3C
MQARTGSPLLATLGSFARVLLVAAALAGGPAWAQSVALSGVVGARALLVVNGGTPKMVAVGETFQGVRVVSAQSDQAVVEVEGKRLTLRMGDSPVSVGQGIVAGQGTRIVLPVSSGGHFTTGGFINGKPVQFVVDTGATVISIGVSDAQRLGLQYTSGSRVNMHTANGNSIGYLMTLDSVRINDVEVFGVQAVVTPQPMPVVLLGNSYLSRFSMRRDSDQLVLEKRY